MTLDTKLYPQTCARANISLFVPGVAWNRAPPGTNPRGSARRYSPVWPTGQLAVWIAVRLYQGRVRNREAPGWMRGAPKPLLAEMERRVEDVSVEFEQLYLTEFIHQLVLESELPHKVSTHCLLLLIKIFS